VQARLLGSVRYSLSSGDNFDGQLFKLLVMNTGASLDWVGSGWKAQAAVGLRSGRGLGFGLSLSRTRSLGLRSRLQRNFFFC
jgi:hypothetical protein